MDFQEQYIQMLKVEMNNRKLINEMYSLRAFARDVGVDASRLPMPLVRKKVFLH